MAPFLCRVWAARLPFVRKGFTLLMTVFSARIAARVVAAAAIVTAAAAPFAAHAQQPGGAPSGAPGGQQLTPQQQQQLLKQMQAQQAAAKRESYKRLGLTQAQITKVEAVDAKYRKIFMTRLTALQKKYGKNPQAAQREKAQGEFRTLVTGLQAQAQKESMSILTPDQRKKLEVMRAEQRAKMGAGAGAAGGGRP